jgi:hypothetical protein
MEELWRTVNAEPTAGAAALCEALDTVSGVMGIAPECRSTSATPKIPFIAGHPLHILRRFWHADSARSLSL